MGMYTGLRFKGIVKPEYRDMVQNIFFHDYEWEDYKERYPFLKEFAELNRSLMIPRGALAYMPSSWDNGSIDSEGFDRHLDMTTGYCSFKCSLKNYSNEIYTFIQTVIPIIMEKTDHIEVMYEEWSGSRMYQLMHGTIIEVEGIKYQDDDDEMGYWLT